MAEKLKKKKKVVRKKKQVAEQIQWDIQWVDIASIKLWGNNPRINEDAAKKLAPIIKAHGIKSPIVCWDKNRTVYKGNTTIKACKILGIEKVPVVFHDFASEVAAEAYGIADNKSGENSEWDENLLVSMMDTKEFKEAKLTTGFTKSEAKSLRDHLNELGDEELYTTKVKSPVYEINGDKPEIHELMDTKKKQES
jgi:hypothetical protein